MNAQSGKVERYTLRKFELWVLRKCSQRLYREIRTLEFLLYAREKSETMVPEKRGEHGEGVQLLFPF